MRKLLWYIWIPVYALYLLGICCFQDTTDWAEPRLNILKRAFASVMLVIGMTAILLSIRAIASSESAYIDRRVDRIEVRQDLNFQEHKEMGERLRALEEQSRNIDRLVYGVVALTLAVLGQWGLALFKVKMGERL